MPGSALLMAAAMSRNRREFGRTCTARFVQPHNAITLSCKDRPPRRPLESGTLAAATNTKWQERSAADVTRACSSEPPEGGSAAEPRLGGFCQLVRAVRRFALLSHGQRGF